MLEAALRYPTSGEPALDRLLIGGVLVLLSPFVLPAFLVYGYLVRSLASVAAGGAEPPSFDGWERLFVDGLKAFVVVFVYTAVPVVLALAMFVPVSVTPSVGGERAPSGVAVIGVIAFFVFVTIALAVAYLLMAALTHFAVEARLGAAFELRSVLRFATTEAYVLAIVLAIVVQIVLAALMFAAVVFTFGLALFVLIPLGAFVNFWASLVTVYLFGTAYRETGGGSIG